MELEGRWNNWLRKTSRPNQKTQKEPPKPPVICTLCHKEIQNGSDLTTFKNHVTKDHPEEFDEKSSQAKKDERIKILLKAAQSRGEKFVHILPPICPSFFKRACSAIAVTDLKPGMMVNPPQQPRAPARGLGSRRLLGIL